MKLTIGGVAQLFQGDLDLGRLAAEQLNEQDLGPNVTAEDFFYGAVAVTQHLQEVRPDMLILIGAAEWGGLPGQVRRRRLHQSHSLPEESQTAVADAVTGYVGIDLIVEVAGAFGALPFRTVVLEVQPASTVVSESLTPEARKGMDEALRWVHWDIRRLPLLEATDRVCAMVAEILAAHRRGVQPPPAWQQLRSLIKQLAIVEHEGEYGNTFQLAAGLAGSIRSGSESEMDSLDHLQWGMIWGLLEELERLRDQKTP